MSFVANEKIHWCRVVKEASVYTEGLVGDYENIVWSRFTEELFNTVNYIIS
jgi:hypothetical protein